MFVYQDPDINTHYNAGVLLLLNRKDKSTIITVSQ